MADTVKMNTTPVDRVGMCDDSDFVSPISTSHRFLFFPSLWLGSLLICSWYYHTSTVHTSPSLCPFVHPSLAHTRSHSLTLSLSHSIHLTFLLTLFFIFVSGYSRCSSASKCQIQFLSSPSSLSLNKKRGPCFVTLFVVFIFTLTGTFIHSLWKSNE